MANHGNRLMLLGVGMAVVPCEWCGHMAIWLHVLVLLNLIFLAGQIYTYHKNSKTRRTYLKRIEEFHAKRATEGNKNVRITDH